jgi:hypothetical protein
MKKVKFNPLMIASGIILVASFFVDNAKEERRIKEAVEEYIQNMNEESNKRVLDLEN